jgi:hypothetical protein
MPSIPIEVAVDPGSTKKGMPSVMPARTAGSSIDMSPNADENLPSSPGWVLCACGWEDDAEVVDCWRPDEVGGLDPADDVGR